MAGKRIVTKNKDGEVVQIVEEHDLDAEQKHSDARWCYGFALGVLATALIFGFAFARFARF